MPTTTLEPTANETPDSGQGGNAVTDATNTGHGSTTASDNPGGGASQTKTCIWTDFAAVGGLPTSASLKLDWSETGFVGDGGNEFTIEYSIDGGSNWLEVISHIDVVGGDSGSADIPLTLPQNFGLVQVRDTLVAAAGDSAGASVTATVSNIEIEVELANQASLISMM